MPRYIWQTHCALAIFGTPCVKLDQLTLFLPGQSWLNCLKNNTVTDTRCRFMTDPDGAQSVRQARRGSQQAFETLYRQFSPLVHAIHLSRFPPAVADELTQECFCKAFLRLDQLQEDAKFGPWIAAIARRMRPPSGYSETTDRELDDFSSHGAPPEEVAEAAHILRTIAGLPEAYRNTLVLRLVEGMSGPEIAALTGLTPESVRVNLHRGMAKLRHSLGLVPTKLPEENDHE